MIFFTQEPMSALQYSENDEFPIAERIGPLPSHLKNTIQRKHNIGIVINTVLKMLKEHKYDNKDMLIDIIDKVLSARFNDINSEFYGIFPYDYYESPEDFHVPDYDYQATILVPLIEIYFEFGSILPKEITDKIKNACLTTAFALTYVQDYIDTHNIVLEILCLICIGENFDNLEIFNAGIHKLHTLVYFTLYNDSFMEYNHPEKILTSAEGINYFKQYIKDTNSLIGIQELENSIFTCFYTHFNPKLMQWSGPLSIIENSLFLSDDYIKRIKSITNQNNLKGLRIPKDYYHFSPTSGNKFVQTLTSRGFSYPHWKFSLVASSYNTATYSLGSFNHDDMWSRRKPCIGFFGTPEEPYCIYMRCMLNNEDFSSGAFHSVQHKGSLLGHIGFSTNRGFKNLDMDCKKIYKMRDLRIRLQIDGNTSVLNYSKNNETISVMYNHLSIIFRLHYAQFNGHKANYQITTLQNSFCIDIILYSGEETDLDLSEIDEAITAFSLSMGTNKNYHMPDVRTYNENNLLISECFLKDLSIKLETPSKPNPIEIIFSRDRQYINNTRIETYADKTKKFSGQHRFIAKNNTSEMPLIPIGESTENKAFLKKIDALDQQTLEKISSSLSKTLNELNNYSINIAQRYSVHILMKLFDAAKKYDVRFENLIEKKYSHIYDKISYTTKQSQMKKILSDTVEKIITDYNKFQISTKKSDNINKIIEIIHSEYQKPYLSLQEISLRLNLSESYISREFHSTIGQSYTAYLLKIRIEKAKSLISEGTNLKDIPKLCGYYSFRTFSDSFKRYTGSTPKKFQRKR